MKTEPFHLPNHASLDKESKSFCPKFCSKTVPHKGAIMIAGVGSNFQDLPTFVLSFTFYLLFVTFVYLTVSSQTTSNQKMFAK